MTGHDRVAVPRLLGRDGIAALLVVMFALSGRWNLSRISSIDLGLFGEPRLYIIVALLFVALVPSASRARGVLEREPATRFVLGTVAFFGYMGLTALWAPEEATMDKLGELALTLAAVLVTTYFVAAAGPDRLAGLVWRWLVPVLAVFAVTALVGVVTGDGRVAVMGGGPNVFGRNMGLLCLSMLSLIFTAKAGPLGSVATVVAGALVVLSGSRGALLATAMGATTMLYLTRKQFKRIVYVVVSVALLGGIVLEFTDIGADAMAMFEHRVLRLVFEDHYDSGRTEVYTAAWNLGLNSPWMGIGLNGFPVLGNHVYPHNIVLEAFSEGGLVGVVLLLACLGPPLGRIVMRTPGIPGREAAAFVLLLVAAQFSGDLFDSRGVFLFAAFILPVRPRAKDPRVLQPAAVRAAAYGPNAAGRASRFR